MIYFCMNEMGHDGTKDKLHDSFDDDVNANNVGMKSSSTSSNGSSLRIDSMPRLRSRDTSSCAAFV